jgi:hypothetical protein
MLDVPDEDRLRLSVDDFEDLEDVFSSDGGFVFVGLRNLANELLDGDARGKIVEVL